MLKQDLVLFFRVALVHEIVVWPGSMPITTMNNLNQNQMWPMSLTLCCSNLLQSLNMLAKS
jgi:hypothetical protein